MAPSETDVTGIIRLENCSLDDVIQALLSCTPIWRGENRDPFVLSNPDSLKLFSHYTRHRDLWRRNRQVQAAEISNLLQALEGGMPEEEVCAQEQESDRKLWTLRLVEAHRFGGLHKHCGPDGQDPELFVLEIDKDITLIAGFNGAGKTALLSTIIWCLTGKALRSQHMPDEVHEPMPVYWTGTAEDGEAAETQDTRVVSVPPVVPVPSGEDLEALNDQPKLDTWVRLTFRAEDTGETTCVTRRLVVRSGGRGTTAVEGLEDLGLTALAIEVGTLMPGVAAQMRFDEKTDFAQAIALLTGLKPLEDFGKRARRVVDRMRGDETQNTESTRTEKFTQFETQMRTLREAWEAQPDLGEPKELTPPGEEADGVNCAASITSTKTYLKETQGNLEASVEQILGRRPELADGEDVSTLLRFLEDAADQLKDSALGSLPTVGTIQALAGLDEKDLGAAEALIQDIVTRANNLAERLEDVAKAARWQLYSRVAAWHKEHHPDVDLANCPVCGTDLKSVPADALLDLSVKEALDRCREADADMAKTAAEWGRDETAAILDALPEKMREFADRSLPEELEALYRQAFVDELLAKPAFSGSLDPLKSNAIDIWEIASEENPLPESPEMGAVELPEILRTDSLATRITNIAHAVRLARHRNASKEATERIVNRYIGAPEPEDREEQPEAVEAIDPDKTPLSEQIDTIRRCVQNTAPVVSLLRQLDELGKTRQEWELDNRRIVQLERAAAAIDPFISFPDLVYEQVTGLINTLHTGTETWLRRLYRPHYLGGPDYSGFDPAVEHGVGLRAAMGDMQVPAHQVMNASLLRACVWAFLFSLWEHVRAQVGGLSCVLLDDPQMQFDSMNSENLAAAIPTMPEVGMRPIVTSNDTRFLASLCAKLPRRTSESPSWTALQLNPISSSRLKASVSPSVEEIRERRDRWKEDENDVQKAQEFVERVRVHVENDLWNLLAADPLVMHDPTLANLLNQLRGARSGGQHPFEELPFDRLLGHPALRDTAPFYGIINNAHHRLNEITPFDAGEVDAVFGEIYSLLRSSTASYARFMGRLSREDSELYLLEQPAAPEAVQSVPAQIPVLGTLAARSTVSIFAEVDGGAVITLSEFGPLALYAIRSPCLGSIALPGQVVIVSVERDARDGDPVIALCGEKIYARMIAKDQGDPSRITLIADRSGTERVPPALLLPTAKTRVLPIIGILYDQISAQGREEACQVESSAIWERSLDAAHIVDDSAYPVVREGDTVLLEQIADVTTEVLQRLEGRIVAVVASREGEWFGFLKRMGPEIQPGIRILEKIGLGGSSIRIVVSGDGRNQGFEAFVLERIWRVHGVIRSEIFPR